MRSKPFLVGDVDLQIDVVLPRFVDVPVRVTDVDGKPVNDAQVSFATTEEMSQLVSLGHLLSPSLEPWMVRTDAKGEVLLHLVPGQWAFGANAPGHRRGSTGCASTRGDTRSA